MKHPVVPGNGPLDARLLILGERPGEVEMRERAPMVGPTGEAGYRALGVGQQWLERLRLAPVGGKRAVQDGILSGLSTRIENVRCTMDGSTAVLDCRDHLQDSLSELSEVRTILCVGADAAEAVLGRGDITKLHGSTWTRVEADAMRERVPTSHPPLRLPPRVHSVVCSFHPAHAMRGLPQLWPLIYRTYQRAKMWSLRESGPQRAFWIKLRPSVEEFREIVEQAEKGDPTLWLVDIESSEERPTVIRMVGIAYAPDTSIVIPWAGEFITLFKRAMRNPKITKAGHNWGFDHKAFLVNGCPVVDPIVNTIEVESILRPPFKQKQTKAKKERAIPWLSLSMSCQYHLDDWPYHKEPSDPATRAFLRASFPDVPEGLAEELYCALDTISNRRLLGQQVRELHHRGLYNLYASVVKPNTPVLARMEVRGGLYDAELAKVLREETKERMERLSQEIRAETAEFHHLRIAVAETKSAAAEALIAHEIAIHPLIEDSSPGGEPAGSVSACDKHPEYRGLTKRGKCPGCAAIYRAAGSLRTKVKQLRLLASKAKARKKALGDAFKPGSSEHWRDYLFGASGLGLTPVAYTDKRKEPKVDDVSIEELQKLNPQLSILQKRLDLSHDARRLSIILNLATDECGYAHFAFSVHRTSTGRSSSGSDESETEKYRESDGGNAQNWRDEDRKLIVAPPGKSWASCDYAQIELRTMAWKAQDLDLLSALQKGLDVHAANAHSMFAIPRCNGRCGMGCPTRKVEVRLEGALQPARQAGKKVTHMVDYGAQEEKVGTTVRPWQGAELEAVRAFVLGANRDWVFHAMRKEAPKLQYQNVPRVLDVWCSTARAKVYALGNTITAKGWIEAYFTLHPKMREYQKELIARAIRDGYIENSWGRRLTVYSWRRDAQGHRFPTDPNDLIAHPGQGDAGEIAKSMLRPLEEVYAKVNGTTYEDLSTGLRLFVHDSFDGDIPQGAESEFVSLARPVMEREFPEMGFIPGFGYFRCPVDFMFGQNWGKYHPEKNPKGLREWSQPVAPGITP